MKNTIYLALVLLTLLSSCEDEDINLFEKSADERAADAIATLKQDLVAPPNGWLVRYKPQEGAGCITFKRG